MEKVTSEAVCSMKNITEETSNLGANLQSLKSKYYSNQ